MLKVGDWIEIVNPKILMGKDKFKIHKIRNFVSMTNRGKTSFSGGFEDNAPFYLDENDFRILTPEEVKDKGLDEEGDFVPQKPNDRVKTVSQSRNRKPKHPYTKLLFIEDGSVDTDALEKDLRKHNPEIKVVVYRQGASVPLLVDIKESK